MDFTKTIIPLALMAPESEPIRARGIIVKYQQRLKITFTYNIAHLLQTISEVECTHVKHGAFHCAIPSAIFRVYGSKPLYLKSVTIITIQGASTSH